ncbi:MAG: flagellar hook-basal body protein [Fimbriimonadaceae bacterium]|nr:flagellar hook-basal body protein [Fimbriimonadaceae bacterium]
MQRGLYSAASGMSVADKWLETISNNLANASTTAYKRDAIVFNEGFERMMSAGGGKGDPIGKLGAGPMDKGRYTIWDAGMLVPTSNPFDIGFATAKGAFKVQTEQGEFYSRSGALTLNDDRELTTKSGERLLDASGNSIVIPTGGQLSITETGEVSVDEQVIGKIAVYDGEFIKIGGDLYTSNSAKELGEGEYAIQQGFIESSNVNAIEEMISMIKLNKAFEMAQKSAQSQDESTERLLRILQG